MVKHINRKGDMGVGKSCLLHRFTDGKCKNSLSNHPVVPDSPHTIGVEFGTRIVEVSGKRFAYLAHLVESSFKFGIQLDRSAFV